MTLTPIEIAIYEALDSSACHSKCLDNVEEKEVVARTVAQRVSEYLTPLALEAEDHLDSIKRALSLE